MADLADALNKVTSSLPGGGEVRPGQVEMAESVAAAIETNTALIVEAGTGTGKSLAYLVPLVLSGQRAVVATATKTLQDQLISKDVPQIISALKTAAEVVVLKGRSNYLCKQRANEMVREVEGELQLEDGEPQSFGDEIRSILAWAGETESGDRAELSFEPRPAAWSQLSVTSEQCPGARRCPIGEDCFAERARAAAELADIIIVNTHLYGAHLASGGHVLPQHDVVVFDEAHALEDIFVSALGIEISPGRISSVARMARSSLDKQPETIDKLIDSGAEFAVQLRAIGNSRLSKDSLSELSDSLSRCINAANQLAEELRTHAPSAEEAQAHLRAQTGLTALTNDLQSLGEYDDDSVYWVEGPNHNPMLRRSPIKLRGILPDLAWKNVKAVVLTSATIPGTLAKDIGLDVDAETRRVASPFDYQHNSLLYVPKHMSDPRTPDAKSQQHDELERLITIAGGRTLALFTSRRAMEEAVEELRSRLEVPVLAQDDAPKAQLVEAFSDDENACLFATMSFWQGVDVPGETLSVVAIDRIPFPRPDEPLNAARRELAGESAFRDVDLPRAATLLAQGAGRLIRTATDRGVVAVLDPRLANAGYRRALLAALPPMRRTIDLAEVEEFLCSPERSMQG